MPTQTTTKMLLKILEHSRMQMKLPTEAAKQGQSMRFIPAEIERMAVSSAGFVNAKEHERSIKADSETEDSAVLRHLGAKTSSSSCN